MDGLIFIVLFFIVFVKVIKKACESDHRSGGTYKSYERYIEDDRENYRNAKSLPQNERTRWYGSSYNTGSGTDNAAGSVRRPGASGSPGRAAIKDPSARPATAGTQNRAAGPGAAGPQDAAARPDTAGIQNTAGKQHAPDVSDTAGVRNVPLRPEADDMANAVGIPHIVSDFAQDGDLMDVYGGPGAVMQSLPDQSDGSAGLQNGTDTQYGFEMYGSAPTDYFGDFSTAAGLDYGENKGNESMAGIDTQALMPDRLSGNAKLEESEKGYFTTDLKAFEYTDVAIDSRIDLDAVMPQVETTVETDGPAD